MALWDSFKAAFGGAPIKAADAVPNSQPAAPRIAGRDGLTNVLAGLGTTRDKRYYNEYAPIIRLSDLTLRNMFRGSWISRRIVTTVADDMTREWVSCTWDNYEDDVETSKSIDDLIAALQVRKRVNTAIRWGRLFGGAAIILVIKGEDWSTPLVIDSIKQGSLITLKTVDKTQLAPIGMLDQDLESPNHGKPLAFSLANVTTPVPNIHWSRVIVFGGQEVPEYDWLANGYWDDSVLQTCVDSISNYDGGRDGAASLLFEANVDILKIAGLTELMSQDGGEAKVAARYQAMALMKSINRMMILNGGEGPNGMPADEYAQKTSTFTGVPEILRSFLTDLCGAADIPATRLFGMSPAGLNATGDSDTRNYYDHVAARQETNLRAQLVRLFDVVIRSAIGSMPEGFGFTFNPLWQMTDTEIATVGKLKAETDKLYVDSGILTEGAVARDLLDRDTYPTMTEDDVDLAEELTMELSTEAPALVGGRGLARGGVQAGPGTVDPNAIALPGDPSAPAPDQKALPPMSGKDAMPGDMVKHEADGWHAYAGDKHLSGPHGTARMAMTRLRQYSRRRG